MLKFLLTDRKKELLASKETIIQKIKYYEKRIACATAALNFEQGYSSDSDNEFSTTITARPSMPKLRTQQSEIRMCWQATQELTGLQILESEINVMVEDPVIQGETPVEEPGLWREVAAECRIGLVPFSITFFVHQPDRKFSSPHYRGLNVLLVKSAHQTELANSVLTGVTRPADAIQVIKSYATAYRSRRTTLARLADKYANNLYMEPLEKGGYLLKCANLFKLSWRLENARSPVGAFQHEMKFNFEYMDESYVKIIKQAHKQLSEPTTDTDDRTLLLVQMITTCLEAQGTNETNESESDVESVNRLEKRRSSLDEDIEAPITKKKKTGQTDEKNDTDTKNRDDQIMAPPKSLPKKVKPKGKENMEGNRKSAKRSNVEESGSNKKAKTDKTANNDVRESENDQVELQNEVEKEKSKTKGDNRNQKGAKVVDSVKNRAKVGANQKNNEKDPVTTGNDTKKSNAKKDSTNKVANEAIESDNRNQKAAKVVDSVKNRAKAGANQNNNEKEPVQNGKDTKKSNAKKDSTNKVANDGISTNKDTEKPSNTKKKPEIANKVQEKNKKKLTKEPGAQVASKDNIFADSKNDPQTKEAENEIVAEKDDNIVGSKNDTKTKVSEGKKLASKGKDSANSITDQITSENKTKKNTVNAKNAVIMRQKDKHLKNDEPQTNKNSDKKTSNDNQKADKATKNRKAVGKPGNNKKNLKNSEAAKKDFKNAKKDIENAKEDIENIRKCIEDSKKLNNNTESAINDTSNADKDSNDQIHHSKAAVINENTINTAKNSKHENTLSNKDKNVPKDSTNTNSGDTIAKTATNSNNNEENLEKQLQKNYESQKSNLQKSKGIENPKNGEEVTTDKTKNSMNPKSKETEKKLTEDISKIKSISNNKRNTIEKAAKVNNVAVKNKEHIAHRANTNNVAKNKPKVGDKNQNKIVTKILPHKNKTAQNKLSKESDAGKPDKNVKPSNTKNFKAGNIAEESSSATKISKIPQKKWSPISESALKKIALRISPRKFPSNSKSSSDSKIKQKVLQKPITNIPRLLKKPGIKPK